MTKKHFEALADSIREHDRVAKLNGENAFTADQLASLARFCASENPRFNKPVISQKRCNDMGGMYSTGTVFCVLAE
jgi:hypothetical protein